uniref:glycine rich domain-containing protein n=1 Tax=Odoribacter lunatus TaxID=2941335 RepID=UPI00203D7231
NGGGTRSNKSNGRNGGGATDIRLIKGEWNNFNSLKSRIIVAGGGGGSDYYNSYGSNGGAAGGLNGYSGNYHRKIYNYSYTVAEGGSQTSGGKGGIGISKGKSGSFGMGGCRTEHSAGGSYGSGGGSGYYGGGYGHFNNGIVGSGAGGSSFISGHSGCDAISASSTSSNIIHTGQSIHYSGVSFTNTVMIDGAGYKWTTAKGSYIGMPNFSGTGTMTGNTGNGQVRITPLN